MKAAATGFAPSYLTQPIPLEIALTTSVETMSPAQFRAYETAIRAANYTAMLPDQQAAWLAALKAVNKRRASELAETGGPADALNVTIRAGRDRSDEMRDQSGQFARPINVTESAPGFALPMWGWVLGAAALMLLLGPKR
jgi:outer membrane autotransporter protein